MVKNVSALKRLRSDLKEQGILGRKKARHEKTHTKSNPFELKINKNKHDVVNRKVQGSRGRPALSKTVAIEKRREKLLPELASLGKKSVFKDRRFGESDPNMSIEEKMMERYARERQSRAAKRNAYNLNDDEEMELTHLGQSLSKLDDFDDMELELSEDEEQGRLNKEIVSQAHFGGFEQENHEKSRAEIMKEVVAKSKIHKMERQKQKEENEDLREELNEEFDAIRSLLVQSTKEERHVEGKMKDLDTNYDSVVRSFAFERRAQPTDRLKTPEEIAKEKYELLVEQERQRNKRMLGIESDDDQDEDEQEVKEEILRYKDGKLVNEEEENCESDDDEEEEDEGEDESEIDEQELQEQEESDQETDHQEFEGLDDHDQTFSDDSEESDIEPSQEFKELPFIIDMPKTHQEFLNIVSGHSLEEHLTVIDRLRTRYDPALGPGNKAILKNLLGILLEHIQYICINYEQLPKEVLVTLANHFAEISSFAPEHSGKMSHRMLHLFMQRCQQNWSRKGALLMPSSSMLLLLKIFGGVFSSSDYRHPITTPAMVLMCYYISLARLSSIKDIVSGLFVCETIIEYNKMSKRIVPECLSFLFNILLHFLPSKDNHKILFPIRPVPFLATERNNLGDSSPSFCEALSKKSEVSSSFILYKTLVLLDKLVDLYSDCIAYIETFEFLTTALPLLNEPIGNDLLRKVMYGMSRAEKSRAPLMLQTFKPVAITMLEPKFEQGFSLDRKYGKPENKLKALYKKETKGAIRELRRDNAFLAQQDHQKRMSKDKEYEKKIQKIYGMIGNESKQQE